MKKCSRTAHVAVTELNIVPLLNLAFVLLVIFIVTTTPLVNDLDVALPAASQRPKDPPPKANFITVEAGGRIFLNRQEVELASLPQQLVALRIDDPDLNVIVRGDGRTKYREIRAVLDACQQANVVKVELATEPLN
ncbi:MAG: biopolymer transporter ExbD [Verrucomicrobiae bacterium]|nr:biopolymer transporter ExbD [Verrucomicrobiae bacterium]